MSLFQGKRARSCIALALLLAACLSQVMPWPPHVRGPAQGEAAAAAIAFPHAPETCSHHPEGCPPDCICPKNPISEGGTASEFPSGPALSRCAGKALSNAPAAYGLSLPEESIDAGFPDPFRYLNLPAPSHPSPGFRSGSGKIPIA
jgi:hypothetical protein